MKGIFFAVLLALSSMPAAAQQKKSSYVVVMTMDGLRWQEVFGGADSTLANDTAADYSLQFIRERFWANTPEERRKKLMPFFWSELAKKGVIMGNRRYRNFVNNANPYRFSYPGYNEIFTGFPDTAVNSNDKRPNKNVTVLEWLNKMPVYKSKIAVFGSWDRFAYIFNQQRSGILVNDGFSDLSGNITDRQKLLNRMQHELPDIFHGSERMDAATFNIGLEYLKAQQPTVLYIALGDADEFAHAGNYDSYLDAAQNFDGWIKQVWEFIQSSPVYANKTTLILTTDHGRGLAAGGQWQHHGEKIDHADEIWMAAIGASIPARGEQNTPAQVFQGQIAATIAELLGENYQPAHKPLPPLKF